MSGGVVARLTTLAEGMRAIVKGRREIEIPTSGSDEITDMAHAVGRCFRDNAVALDQLLEERELKRPNGLKRSSESGNHRAFG